MGWANPSRKTKFAGAYGDRGKLIFPVQLSTSRIGNHIITRLICTQLHVMTMHEYKQLFSVVQKAIHMNIFWDEM